MTTDLSHLMSRWDSGEGRPFKGRLIDWNSYGGNGIEPPSDLGCMCAQGQVLHLLGGWSPRKLHATEQAVADKESAKLLGISVAHAILLRNVNDSVDGAPSIVLTHPEKVIGDQAHIVLAFWRHLDRMTAKQWADARADARVAARVAAREAARVAAREAAWEAAGVAAWEAAWDASNEIQGASVLRKQGKPFFFLPLFGFADPEAVLLADGEQQ